MQRLQLGLHSGERMMPPWLSSVQANSARAIDISYYRFCFSCQTTIKSIHVYSEIFQWTWGKGSVKSMCGWGLDFSHLLPSSLCSVCCVYWFIGTNIFFSSLVSFLPLALFYFLSLILCLFVYVAGIRSWDTNLIDCNLDQELKLFVSRHSARFSADVRGKLEIKDIFTDNFKPAVWLMP